MHPHVPGWPFQRPAGGIQSPYFHRASGLAQIAVSTLLRNSSSGNRKFLHAEHCRYGTRDLHQLTRFWFAIRNRARGLQPAGASKVSNGCKPMCRLCDRSLVGTESKSMLLFAKKMICLCEFR